MDAETGEQHVFFSKRPINKRGTRFPLPIPRGGRNGRGELLMTEDDLIRKHVIGGVRKNKKKVAYEDLIDLPKQRLATKGIVIGRGKRNPNKARKKTGKKNRSKARHD